MLDNDSIIILSYCEYTNLFTAETLVDGTMRYALCAMRKAKRWILPFKTQLVVNTRRLIRRNENE